MRVTRPTITRTFKLSFLASVAFSLASAGCGSGGSTQATGGAGGKTGTGGAGGKLDAGTGGMVATGGAGLAGAVGLDAGAAGSTATGGVAGKMDAGLFADVAAGGTVDAGTPDHTPVMGGAGVDAGVDGAGTGGTGGSSGILDGGAIGGLDAGSDLPIATADAADGPAADVKAPVDAAVTEAGASCLPPQWAKKLSVPSIFGMATDQTGNVFVATTYFKGDLDSIPLTSAGSADLAIAKIDPATGAAGWAKLFGDASDQIATRLAVSKSGQVGVVGTFTGGMVVGNAITNSAAIPIDFIAAVDSNGGGLWAKALDTQGGQLNTVAGNPAQDAFVVCGYTTGAVTDLDPKATANSDGKNDALVAKINSATGAVLWGRQLGGAGAQMCQAAAMDAAGNVFLAGNFNGTLDLGSGALSPAPAATSTARAIWAAKLDGATGATIVAKSWGNDLKQQVTALATDAAGNLGMVGAMKGVLTVGAYTMTGAGYGAGVDGGAAPRSNTDGYAVKLDGSLTPLWAHNWGDTWDQDGQALAFDSHGNMIVAGALVGTADFGGGVSLTAATGPDVTGDPLPDAYWAELKGDTGVGVCGHRYGDDFNQVADRVVVSKGAGGADSIIVAGHFNGILDFGLSTGQLIASIPGTSSSTDPTSFLVGIAP